MADRVASEFVLALVEETVMGLVGTAEFAFHLVVDPENTIEGVADSIAYLVENPEVLVEAAKTMYTNFNEGTPEERAQMLGSAASYLIPGVTLTKAGKANKVVDGLQSTAKAADKAKDINKLFEAPKSIMDLLPFTILETSTGHRMIVPKDLSRNVHRHDSPDVGGSGSRLGGTGKIFTPESYSDHYDVPYSKVRSEKVVNALNNFESKKWIFGNENILLDKSGIKHMLERHHPKFYNGTLPKDPSIPQSFFDQSMTIDDLNVAIDTVLKQNRDKIIDKGTKFSYQITGTYGGAEYILGFNKGRIGQFYPVPK